MTTTKLTIPDEVASKPMVFLTVGQAFDFLDLYFEAKAKTILPTPEVAPSEETHYNYAEAVAFCKISKPTFATLRKEGKIKGIQVSKRRVLFMRSDLQAYLQSTHE
jgi:hypothetical protein